MAMIDLTPEQLRAKAHYVRVEGYTAERKAIYYTLTFHNKRDAVKHAKRLLDSYDGDTSVKVTVGGCTTPVVDRNGQPIILS